MQKQVQETYSCKKVYLLGQDGEGIRYWLEEASWDCNWYWGFGYIETYENNKLPSEARDIDSHQHADGEFVGDDSDKNIFTGDFLKNKSFDEKEGWTLRELMTSFYQLKGQAQLYQNGNMHISNNPLSVVLKNEKEGKYINEVLIPLITKEITKILSPDRKKLPYFLEKQLTK